jgi:DNA primase
MAGKVAVLPAGSDPDDFARERGRQGVEALLAGARPLSEYLVDGAIERTCAGRPREASLEAKLAAVHELAPFVVMTPEGLARSVFEDAIARRLDLDVAALRTELSGGRRQRDRAPAGAAQARPVAPRAASAARMRLSLPGPAADALGLLAAFPQLGSVAEEENLPGLLPPGPLADLARDMVREPLPLDQALARVEAGADAATLRRVREIAGPARPEPALAERELRRASVKAAIEAIRGEQDRLLALVAREGTPVPDDLSVATQVAARRRADLEKRLRSLERSG